MASGPVVAMVWEGLNAVKTGRVMLGETNPADSKPGTIRGDFAVQVSVYFNENFHMMLIIRYYDFFDIKILLTSTNLKL